MKQILFRYIFTLILIVALSSCSMTYLSIYGIKKIRFLEEKEILDYGKQYKIPYQDSYQLDTSYFSFMSNLDSDKYGSQIKNHLQPLQALYYNQEGELLSFHINCYAGGFPNLKWDRNDIFSTFPPKEQAPIDRILSLADHMKFAKPMSQTENLSIVNFDNIVIVYWSRFMGRQSKRLINYVQANERLAYDRKVKIVYINADNIFAGENKTAAGNKK